MREILRTNEKIMVGEIGLDYRDKTIDKKKQRSVFESQVDLAIEMNRSMSIHSVRAHGDLLKILQKRFLKQKKTNGVTEGQYQTAVDFVNSFKLKNESELDRRQKKKLKKMKKKIEVYKKQCEAAKEDSEIEYVKLFLLF